MIKYCLACPRIQEVSLIDSALAPSTRLLLGPLAFLMVGCATGAASGNRGDAQLFEPGVISTSESDELTPSFSPDGRRLVFVRRTAGGPFTLHESRWTWGGWSKPGVLMFSGTWNDQAPSFSPDGRRLFFQSRRPADPGRAASEDAARDDDLWVVELGPDGWGEPRPVAPPVRRTPPPDGGEPFEGREMAPSVDRAGNLFYWSHVPGDSHGASDLYRAPVEGDGHVAPENLGTPVNSPHYETHPWIDPDGRFLLFACDGCPGAIGRSDLYVSRRMERGWSVPVNLGPAVNSEAYDFGATLSPDRSRLYLSSDRGVEGSDRGRQNIHIVEVAQIPALGFLASQAGSGGLTVEYLANEGVLVRAGDRALLVDALFGEGLPEYPVVEPARRDSLERARGRFGTIELILVTHVHRDHFDAGAVARHLVENPRARLVAPGQVVDSLRAELEMVGQMSDRVRALALQPGETARIEADGVAIVALGLGHPPSRNEPVEHVAYRVEAAGARILHLGDAMPGPDDLPWLRETAGELDLLLAPWWTLTGEAGERLLAALDVPRIAAFHLPRRPDRGRSSEQAAGTVVLDEPGESLTVPGKERY